MTLLLVVPVVGCVWWVVMMGSWWEFWWISETHLTKEKNGKDPLQFRPTARNFKSKMAGGRTGRLLASVVRPSLTFGVERVSRTPFYSPLSTLNRPPLLGSYLRASASSARHIPNAF
jgi:hypothetical protein